jgi:hypothetical protein
MIMGLSSVPCTSKLDSKSLYVPSLTRNIPPLLDALTASAKSSGSVKVCPLMEIELRRKVNRNSHLMYFIQTSY